MKLVTTILGAAALGIAGSSATAEELVVTAEVLPTERVSYADLNLASSSGQAILDRRIRGAAKRLCVDDARKDVENRTTGKICYNLAVADGRDQMNQAMFAQRSGTPLAAATIIVRAR